MTKDVLVSVRGTQIMSEEHDTIEVITAGTYCVKNGKHYIIYEEAVEGVDEATKNTVKADPSKVEVIKRGPVKTRLVFEKGKKYLANYMTPLGLIVLGITTKDLSAVEEEDTVRISLNYVLEMNGEYVSNCLLEVSACSRREGALNLKAGGS